MSVYMPQVDESDFNPQRLIYRYVQNHTPFDIYMKIKEKVLGQEAAIRQASLLVYAYLKTLAYGNYTDYKYHFMIEAESGCGKTTFANALKAVIPIPLTICDASQTTANGWKGMDAADLMDNPEFEKWGCGIVILDELDKAIMPLGTDVPHHRLTQESFLKMLDGGVVYNRDGKSFECDRFLFIGMGAFAQMRTKQPESRSIGFGTSQKAAQVTISDVINRDRITAVCGSEQFMGRMVAVLHFNRLGIKHYRSMLDNAVKEVCQMYGAWELPKEAEDRILRQALESPYGARNIRNMIWEYFMAADSSMIRQMKQQEAIDHKLREGILPDEEDRDFLYRKLLASEDTMSA